MTSSGATAYTYTVENRLSSVSGTMTAYYDTLGRLAEYDTSISTRFLYDGDRVTAELDNQGAVNPVKRRYIWGAGADELVAWYEGIGSATRRFPVQDERASIVAVSDSAGTLVGINRYDEYGIPASTNIGRFQYTGQAFLAEAGLHHYKARAYSPTLGRFMQTDPIGYKDGINWYDYVGNDPLNRSDPSGLQSFERAGSEEFRRATERGMSDGQAGTKAAMDGLKGIAAGIAVGAVVIAATPEAAAVTATNAARTAATEATAGGSTRGAVSGLVTKAKEIFTGASTNAGGPGGPTNPAVEKVVDSIPKGVQSVFHGCCGEVNAVSKALNAGADVAGSTIRTISIQTGKVIEACSSCQAILTRFGIKF
jgi:RHS repeat-associated protein